MLTSGCTTPSPVPLLPPADEPEAAARLAALVPTAGVTYRAQVWEHPGRTAW